MSHSPRLSLSPNNFRGHSTGRALPTGTVTLLLADIEGSTRLWEQCPDEMAAALAVMDRELVQLVHANHGVCPVQQGEGDSFVVAFSRASDAVACALGLQQAALAPIRLRIGLHTGEVQLRDEDNYVGPTINRAARLRDLGHGGQTLLSGTTSELACDALPDHAWLIDRGRHRLRDLPRAERLTQLCHPDLGNDFPPLRTSAVAESCWRPVQLTTFVGRASELGYVRDLLRASRLLTVAGPGGIGKTRLAIEAATGSAGCYADGVCFVDLAGVTDPEYVAAVTARALAVPGLPDSGVGHDLVTRHIGDRNLLLVMDNCEHLLDECAALTQAVLKSCPNVSVLGTSRQPLGVGGEQVWRVPGMSHDDAIELFTDRARRACSEFALDAAVVRELCQRLDGLPLAIELAAARVRAFSLDEIADGLRDRFQLLMDGPRTVAHRQQTLRACVEWSFALLTTSEREVLQRLSLFPDDFDVEAAEAVAGRDAGRPELRDVLASLVDKSLLTAEPHGGRTRYRFSETVRQYAAQAPAD